MLLPVAVRVWSPFSSELSACTAASRHSWEPLSRERYENASLMASRSSPRSHRRAECAQARRRTRSAVMINQILTTF